MKKTETVPTTDKKIAELDELQGRLEEITAELYKAGAVIRNKTGEQQSLKQSLEIFIQDYKEHHSGIDLSTTKINFNGHFDASRLDATQREKYDEMLSNLVSVEKELFEAKKHQCAIQEQEASLVSKMSAMNMNYATECLLHLQKKHNEAEQTVCTINDAITAQQNIIEQEKSANQPAITEAMKKREEILANVALGTVDKNELIAIDEQLREAADTASESTEKLNETVTTAHHTIIGLQRKRAIAQDELEAVRFAKVTAEERFLRAEAEKVGLEYAEAASILAASFRRLLALDTIMDNKKMATIEYGNSRRISIPLFSLECHKEYDKELGEREFDSIKKASRSTDIEADMQSEFDRFAGIGISIQF